MRNRAKCKLCKNIIESFTNVDFVACMCGEIGISGGTSKYEAFANNWDNFLRVDDEGNEIIPKITYALTTEEENEIVKKVTAEKMEEIGKPNTKELLTELDRMILKIEELPLHVMTSPITHYDFAAALLLISAIFRSRDIQE